MHSKFFPWIVQSDITTMTGAGNGAELSNNAARWFLHSYKRHPVQFYSILETACVFTTLQDIANNQAGNAAGDPVRQALLDTIDSIALQQITDFVPSLTTYVDMSDPV